MQHNFLQMLKCLLADKQRTVPPWLEDLLVSGPRLELCLPETRPNRVLITEFLAWWMKSVGISHGECLDWLDPYASEVLARYSKSGMSAIRHGTKANVRWVYGSSFNFDFDQIAREAAAKPSNNEPAFIPVLMHWNEALWEAKRMKRESYVPPVFGPGPFVEERFREQYRTGLEAARKMQADGMQLSQIVARLNKQGFVNGRGRGWRKSSLTEALSPPEEKTPPSVQVEPASP